MMIEYLMALHLCIQAMNIFKELMILINTLELTKMEKGKAMDNLPIKIIAIYIEVGLIKCNTVMVPNRNKHKIII